MLCVCDAFQEELAASVAEQQAAALAAGLLEAKKDSVTDDSVIGPSMPEPEPVHAEVLNFPSSRRKMYKHSASHKICTVDISHIYELVHGILNIKMCCPGARMLTRLK